MVLFFLLEPSTFGAHLRTEPHRFPIQTIL